MTTIRRLLPASGIRAVFDQARAIEQSGRPVLHLEIGRPDWKLPPGATAEAKVALDEGFVHYLDAFKYGMPPEGGFGIGLERLTARIIGLANVKEAALFPRDINRLTP